MGSPRLYLDEDVFAAVATGLRRRGVDVLTAREASNEGSTDEEQLRFATLQARVLLTFNRGHFASLHARVVADGGHHSGIVVCRQGRVGAIVRAMCHLLADRDAGSLFDQLFWLAVE